MIFENKQSNLSDHRDPDFFPEENSNESEQSGKLQENLSIVAKIATLVDNPCSAIAFVEIKDLLLDLGLFLQNVAENRQRNSEIFEDPLNRSDPLGNVLMIHKHVPSSESDLLMRLGVGILNLCHQAELVHKKQEQSDQIIGELDLEDYDDVRSESLLEAKRLISSLRRENKKLDRRNDALWIRLQKLQELIPNNSVHQTRVKPPCKRSDQQHQINLCTVDSDDKSNHQSRKLETTEAEESQTDFSFEDD